MSDLDRDSPLVRPLSHPFGGFFIEPRNSINATINLFRIATPAAIDQGHIHWSIHFDVSCSARWPTIAGRKPPFSYDGNQTRAGLPIFADPALVRTLLAATCLPEYANPIPAICWFLLGSQRSSGLSLDL